MTIESEQRVLREVVLDQLTTGEIRAYRMWLPPLADPTPVNELVERDHQRRRCGSGSASWTSRAAPPGSMGHRRVAARRQHRRRRRPADRQVDVPADPGAVGGGHAHARDRSSSTASTSAVAA